VHKRFLLVSTMLLLVATFYVPSVHAGYWEKTVDVMVIADEEFNFEFPHGWQRYLGWGIYIGDAFAHFESVFGIEMILRGWWDTWDSTDGEDDIGVLLQEALRECGGVYNTTSGFWEWEPKMVNIPGWGSYHIDLVMVFTGQYPTDYVGFSPPEWNALIVRGWYPDVPRTQLLMHELSHQFNCQHCNDVECVMYKPLDPFEIWHAQWCLTCQTTINANKARFWRWVETGGGGGGGECPTLFVWNGTHYADEGVLDIHAESDITVQHEIQNTLTLKGLVYSLELRELDNFTSHLDQVKLYAVDDQGEWHLSPLIYAVHSELGWVTWKLRFDDENRVDMTPTQSIDLGFLPSIPYSEAAYFVFETNGHNRKALY
jgi:hypothetical protein